MPTVNICSRLGSHTWWIAELRIWTPNLWQICPKWVIQSLDSCLQPQDHNVGRSAFHRKESERKGTSRLGRSGAVTVTSEAGESCQLLLRARTREEFGHQLVTVRTEPKRSRGPEPEVDQARGSQTRFLAPFLREDGKGNHQRGCGGRLATLAPVAETALPLNALFLGKSLPPVLIRKSVGCWTSFFLESLVSLPLIFKNSF